MQKKYLEIKCDKKSNENFEMLKKFYTYLSFKSKKNWKMYAFWKKIVEKVRNK